MNDVSKQPPVYGDWKSLKLLVDRYAPIHGNISLSSLRASYEAEQQLRMELYDKLGALRIEIDRLNTQYKVTCHDHAQEVVVLQKRVETGEPFVRIVTDLDINARQQIADNLGRHWIDRIDAAIAGLSAKPVDGVE